MTDQQKVWDWLIAERLYITAVRRWLRQEGVPRDVIIERRFGRPEQPRRTNRAARRRMRAVLRKVA